MTGREYVVKVARIDAQIDSAGIALGEADAAVRSALTPRLDDLVRGMEEFRSKASAVQEQDALDFTVASAEEEALNTAGAALAALMSEVERHLSDAQKAAAQKYAVGTQVGMKDLYASEAEYKAALTRAVSALQPTVSDLALVSPGKAEALMQVMSVEPGMKIPWKPLVIGGVVLLAVWGGLRARRRGGSRASAGPSLAKLPRVLRGRIKGILRFKEA